MFSLERLHTPKLHTKVNILIVQYKNITVRKQMVTRKSITCMHTSAPVLPLTEHHAMKAYWGSGGTVPPIFLPRH
jgi:hypothetical protein